MRKRGSEWTPLGHKWELRDQRKRLLEPLLRAAVTSTLPDYLATLEAPPDWRRTFELAQVHGVAAILLDAFAEVDVVATQPPQEILQAARRQHALASMAQRRHDDVLATLLAALDEAKIKVVALKGPLLAERYWRGRERRLSSDLDFLVAPSQFAAAATVLAAHGYQQHSPRLTRLSRWRFPDVKFQPTSAAPAGAPLVELHWLAAYGFGTHLDTTRLLDRAQRYESPAIAAPAWVLEPTDELLALAIHGAKHQFERLAWLVDLVLLLRSAPITQEDLHKRARAVGAWRVLGYTAAEVSRCLGIDVLADGPPMRHRQAQRLAERIHGLADYSVAAKLQRIAFNLQLAQNNIRRMRYLAERTAAALSRILR